MYGRPWYVQATDVAHRLFVLTIIGGSIYITGGLATTLFMNRASVRAQRNAITQEQEELAQASVASALDNSEGKGKGSDVSTSSPLILHFYRQFPHSNLYL